MTSGKAQTGFTIVEFMVVTMIIAVLATLAAPSFQSLLASNRVSAIAGEFLATLNFARSEAVKRGVRVTVCVKASDTQCATSGSWAKGWIIFTDGGTAATVDGSDQVLRTRAALPGSVTMTGNQNVALYVSYLPSGLSRMASGAMQAGTLSICTTGDPGRDVIIAVTGRPSIALADKSCPT